MFSQFFAYRGVILQKRLIITDKTNIFAPIVKEG